MKISEDPSPLGDKGTDKPKMENLPSSQICLAPLIKVHVNCYYQIKGHLALIRHMFPNYNKLFDPHCKIDFLQISMAFNTQIKPFVTTYRINSNVSENTLQV